MRSFYSLVLTERTGYVTGRQDLAALWRAAGRSVGRIELAGADESAVLENDTSGEAAKFVEAALNAEQSK